MDFAQNPIDGCPIAYRYLGSEHPDSTPTIVLVHGTALSQAIWRGFGWVRDLEVDHRVIALDLRGHGRSGTPHDPSAYDMSLFVGDVNAVLDAAGIDHAHYVGYSLGARIGFSLALKHPDRVSSLVTYGGSPKTGPGVFDRTFFTGCIDVLERDGLEGFIAGWEEQLGYSVDKSTRIALLANDAIALAAYMRETERDPGVPDASLRAMRTPLFMIAGTEDHSRVRAAAKVQALLPGTPVRLLDGATHGRTPRHEDALPELRRWLYRRE